MSTILVVDDSGRARNGYRRQLEKAGYEVEQAEDGQQGLDILINEEINLILTDLDMPRMNGKEMLTQVVELGYGDTPVIVVSGNVRSKLNYPGPITRFGKPTSSDQYLAAIEKLLSR